MTLKRKHAKTLAAIFSRPVSGTIAWSDIESLFVALGAEVNEREGSRIAVVLFGEVRVFTVRTIANTTRCRAISEVVNKNEKPMNTSG